MILIFGGLSPHMNMALTVSLVNSGGFRYGQYGWLSRAALERGAKAPEKENTRNQSDFP